MKVIPAQIYVARLPSNELAKKIVPLITVVWLLLAIGSLRAMLIYAKTPEVDCAPLHWWRRTARFAQTSERYAGDVHAPALSLFAREHCRTQTEKLKAIKNRTSRLNSRKLSK